jgi:PAS domain S-box-containing protein
MAEEAAGPTWLGSVVRAGTVPRLNGLVPFLILCVGLALSTVAYFESRWADEDRVRTAIDAYTKSLSATLEGRLADAAMPIYGLATFLSIEPALNATEFRAFASAARGTDPIARLTWAPRVAGARRLDFENRVREEDSAAGFELLERDANSRLVRAGDRTEYYPVRFEQSYESTPSLLGFDHLSGSNRRAAMERARDQGAPVATGIVRPIPDEPQEDRIVLFWPVYEGGTVPKSQLDRRDKIIGFATGAFLVHQLLDAAWRDFPARSVVANVMIGAASAGSGTVAAQMRLDSSAARSRGTPLGGVANGVQRVTRSFDAYGQVWTLVVDVEPDSFADRTSSARWNYLGLGLVLTLVVSAYVASQQRSRSRTESLVFERTRNLHRTSDQLRAIIDSSPLATGTTDAAGSITGWNRSAEEILGYGADEVVGTRYRLALPTGTNESATLLDRALAGEVLRGVEAVVLHKDGRMLDCSICASAFRDSDGQTQGVVFSIEDTTARKRDEEELRRARSFLDLIIQNVPEFLYVKDARELRFVLCNQSSGRHFGSDAAGLIGMSDFDLHPKELAEQFAARERAVLESKEMLVIPEERFIGLDGKPRIVRTKKIPVMDSDGKPIFLIGLAEDISEELRRNAAERELVERLRGIVDSSQDAIVSKTLDGTVTTWNPAAESLFGYTAEEIIGKSISVIAIPGHEDDMRDVLQKVASGQTVNRYRTKRQRKDGSIVDIMLTVSPIHDDDGRIIGASKIARDIGDILRAEAIQARQMSQMRAFVEQAPQTVAMLDRDLRYVATSGMWKQEYGGGRSSLVGLSHYEVSPNVPEIWRENNRRALAGETIRNEEFRWVGPDGGERWARSVVQPWTDTDGTIGGIIIVVDDFTHRKLAEISLRESEQRFAAVFRDSPIGILITDVESGGKIVETNDAWLKTIGYERDEVIGHTSGDLNLWVDPNGRGELYRALSSHDAIWGNEVRIRRKDGTILDYATTLRRIEIGGRPSIIALGYDVTERKRLENERDRAHDQLTAIVDASPVAIIGIDPDDQVVAWNRAATTIFGYTFEEAMGRRMRDIVEIPTTELPFVEERIRRVRRGENLRSDPGRRRRKDGTWIDVTISAARRTGAHSEFEGIVLAIEDITDRKRLEGQLVQALKMEAVGQLTGGIAHDFNNLLTVILGNLELVDESIGSDEDLHRMIRSAIDAARGGADLTHRLLAFSRRQNLAPEAIDLNRRIAQFIPLVARTLGEAIQTRLSLSDSLWPVTVDPSQFDNALLNLAVNARDAMPDGGWLEIATENVTVDHAYAAQHDNLPLGDYVRVSVTDSGHGMLPDVVSRVFEPFFTTKPAGKGTGLGLSMVYGFIKQSGGNATIYSEVGKGTVVRILLPRVADHVGDARTVGAVETKPPTGRTILVVEDDAKVRAVTVAFLASLGYRTLDAETAWEALALLDSHPEISLLFTDVVLAGGETGPKLSREAQRRRPGVKVLFTSGYAEEALSHGGHFDDKFLLLQKPFTKSALAEKVREAIESE